MDTDVNVWIRRITTAQLAGDHMIADSLVQQALCETDRAPKVLEIAGVLAFNQGRHADAIDLIEEAMFVQTLSITSQITLAKAFLREGRRDRAMTTASFLVDIIQRIPCEMLADVSQVTSELRRYDLALSVCQEALKRHPEDDQAIFGAAFYMFRLGYPSDNVKDLMYQAIEISPETEFYRLNLAVVFYHEGEMEQAYQQIQDVSDEALEMIPCGCMNSILCGVLTHFEDRHRLQVMRSASNTGSQPWTDDENQQRTDD